MAVRSAAGAPSLASWVRPCARRRRDRRRRQIAPLIEALDGRLLLAGASSASPAPIGPASPDTPAPQQLGAAYQQVVAIQTATLRSLGNSCREVQAAGAQLAGRTAIAIDQLNAALSQVTSQHQALAIAAAIRRDRHILNLGGAHAARVEQGLDVARAIADQQADSDKTDIPNGLFTSLRQLVRQAQSTGTAISRSGQRSANALVRTLDGLGDQLASTIRFAAIGKVKIHEES
jgi:hypothetical protein